MSYLPHTLFSVPLFPVSDTSKPPTHSNHHPLPDNIEYRSRSYKVVSGNMSWYDAMHMCKKNDSDLVSVTDAYHQAFLTVLVNRLAVPHWIGLYSEDVCILSCNMYYIHLLCLLLYVCVGEVALCLYFCFPAVHVWTNNFAFWETHSLTLLFLPRVRWKNRSYSKKLDSWGGTASLALFKMFLSLFLKTQ